MACQGCHAAKVKCVRQLNEPCCRRCHKLEISCIPHKSRQGRWTKTKDGIDRKHVKTSSTKRRHPQRQHEEEEQADMEGFFSPTNPTKHKKTKVERSITESVISAKSSRFFGPNHFGLYCMVRKWMALAIRRRSVQLWSRAFALAHKCSISMDDIFCGTDRYGKDIPSDTLLEEEEQQQRTTSPKRRKPPPQQQLPMHRSMRSLMAAVLPDMPRDDDDENDMNHTTSHSRRNKNNDLACMQSLMQLVWTPRPSQQVIGPRLSWNQIPRPLLAAVYPPTARLPTLQDVPNKWILVRQVVAGQSQYFVSDAFAQDICSYQAIVDCYTANNKTGGGEVKDLWTVRPQDKYQHSLALVHQIQSCRRYCASSCSKLLQARQISNLHVQLANKKVVECNVVVCMMFCGTDHSVYFSEYHSPRPVTDMDDNVAARPQSASPSSSAASVPIQSSCCSNNNNNNNVMYEPLQVTCFHPGVSELVETPELVDWLEQLKNLA